MVTIKGVSIKNVKNLVRIELTCSSNKMKEKVIKLDMPPAEAETLARKIRKFVEKHRDSEKEKVNYIG